MIPLPRARRIGLLSWGGAFGSLINFGPARWGLSTDAAVAVDSLNERIEMLTPGRLSLLRVRRQVTPGVGTTVTYTVRVNGVNTAITCTMANGPTTAEDLVNSVNVVPGDVVEVFCSAITGAPANSGTIVSLGVAA